MCLASVDLNLKLTLLKPLIRDWGTRQAQGNGGYLPDRQQVQVASTSGIWLLVVFIMIYAAGCTYEVFQVSFIVLRTIDNSTS